MDKKLAKLCIGPMSPEIIRAVFRFSQVTGEPLMLIASKNQIDWNGGYVNNWTTKEYMDFVRKQREDFPQANVLISRDHCGPGFRTGTLEDVYTTIETDIDNGFDMMHVDFCHSEEIGQAKLDATQKAVDYTRNLKPDVLIEVGTDENTGVLDGDLERIKRELDFFTSKGKVDFYVIQTGSLVKEDRQVGEFAGDFVRKVRGVANQFDVKIKEHNTDFLPDTGIALRHGLIDAMNVAPQYGILQTKYTLLKCDEYGIDPKEFLQVSYASKRWEKWMKDNSEENKLLCATIAGHYNFAEKSYRALVEKLEKHESFFEGFYTTLANNFMLYIANL